MEIPIRVGAPTLCVAVASLPSATEVVAFCIRKALKVMRSLLRRIPARNTARKSSLLESRFTFDKPK
jgi:hypothetical protein